MDAGCVATKGLSARHGTVHQHIKTTSRHSVLPPYDSIGKLEPCPASHKRPESALSWLAMGTGENPLGVLPWAIANAGGPIGRHRSGESFLYSQREAEGVFHRSPGQIPPQAGARYRYHGLEHDQGRAGAPEIPPGRLKPPDGGVGWGGFNYDE